jgi:hypothetical protein
LLPLLLLALPSADAARRQDAAATSPSPPACSCRITAVADWTPPLPHRCRHYRHQNFAITLLLPSLSPPPSPQ